MDWALILPTVNRSFCFLPEAVCFHFPEHSIFKPEIMLDLESLTRFNNAKVIFATPLSRFCLNAWLFWFSGARTCSAIKSERSWALSTGNKFSWFPFSSFLSLRLTSECRKTSVVEPFFLLIAETSFILYFCFQTDWEFFACDTSKISPKLLLLINLTKVLVGLLEWRTKNSFAREPRKVVRLCR